MMKLEVKIWFGIDEDANNESGWEVQKERRDIGTAYDIVIPKTITITIPPSGEEEKL